MRGRVAGKSERLTYRCNPALLVAERGRGAVHRSGRPEIDVVPGLVAAEVAETVAIDEELPRTLHAERRPVRSEIRVDELGQATDCALFVQERDVCRRVALRLGEDVAGLDGRTEAHARGRGEKRA